MALYFVTGNRRKFAEVQSILSDVEQLDMDLPEIQDLDAKKVIQAKLAVARSYRAIELLVEDTSLSFRCLNGLPGPLIKWFLQALGDNGLYHVVHLLGDDRAEARTVIGYAASTGEVHFFEATLPGCIVAPRGENGFGWDRVFKPEGAEKTFAEMSDAEKNACSMRRAALDQFRRFYLPTSDR
jgi:non-canonical purine NTP pyrophosphatase (RdgB/HAM1 family)